MVVDLFDNYFSWSPGVVARQLHWQWLRALRSASVVMCSSNYLKGVLATLTEKKIVRVSDPVPEPSPDLLDSPGQAMLWRSPKRLEVLWFGIAGNPFYPVGLQDLVAWSPLIRRLCMEITLPLRLTICTNRVSAVEQAMEVLGNDSIDVRFVEWTEESCDNLLHASHVVLLPTNSTGFGLAKTHNRCSDSLARGCLVLASPDGPYQGLGGAVFESVTELGRLLRAPAPEQIKVLVEHSLSALRARQDLNREVSELLAEVLSARRIVPKAEAPVSSSAVLIVARVKSSVAKTARGLQFLLAGFEGFGSRLNYDFTLQSVGASDGRAALMLSERALLDVERQLALKLELDVDDRGEVVTYQHRDWCLKVYRQERRIEVLDGIDESTLQELGRAQELAASATSTVVSGSLDVMVGVMARVLRFMGLQHLELAAEQEGGWPTFAAEGDPELAVLSGRLERLWRDHEGREALWQAALPAPSGK